MTSLQFLATYPLVEEARAWLRDEGPGIDDLLTDFVYNRARDRARRRVRTALRTDERKRPEPQAPPGQTVPDDPGLRPPGGALAAFGDDLTATDPDAVLLNEIDAEMELLSHPLSRILVAAVDEPILTRRWAVAESKRLSKHLENEPGNVVATLAEALDVPFRRRDDAEQRPQFGLHFTEYLMRAPAEKAWHLIRRDPEAGYVWLDKEDFVRLLEAVYKQRIEGDLEGRAKNVPAVVQEVFRNTIEELKQEAQELAARFKKAELKEVEPGAFPPCIARIRQDMHDHVNVSHAGRFAIVTFLNNLGMDSDGILEFFSSVPDFDPEKSRYQIEHITGKGAVEAYSVPGCATMQTNGVCPLDERDDLCAQIKHPMQHYRKNLWRYKQDQRKKAHEDAKKAAAGADQERSGADKRQTAEASG